MYGLLVSLLFCGLSQAAKVYLSPPENLPSRLSPQQANLVLAAHLGLEQFEVVNQQGRLDNLFSERDFVGQGDQSALLLLVDEAYARDIIPSSFESSFGFSESESPSDFLSSLVKTSTQRASHVYTHVAGGAPPASLLPTEGIPRTLDIFSAPTPAGEVFLAEAWTLIHYLDLDLASINRFAALELTSMPILATSYGRSSQEYTLATRTIQAVIESTMTDESVHLALVAYSPDAQGRSSLLFGDVPSVHPSRQLSSCLTSAADCANATNGCSGHGQCTRMTRAGNACFVCTCTNTVSEAGKVQSWAGERCERKDISGPFTLIAGTVITLILLMGGAVSLLYGIGDHELPSILTGGVAGGIRKE